MALDYTRLGLSEVGRYLVRVDLDVFQERYDEAASRGVSRDEMVRVMAGTFEDSAYLMLEYGDDLIQGSQGSQAYSVMATLGYDVYVNGGMAREDAVALVNANYRAGASRSTRSTACKSKPKVSSKSKSAKGRTSARRR